MVLRAAFSTARLPRRTPAIHPAAHILLPVHIVLDPLPVGLRLRILILRHTATALRHSLPALPLILHLQRGFHLRRSNFVPRLLPSLQRFPWVGHHACWVGYSFPS